MLRGCQVDLLLPWINLVVCDDCPDDLADVFFTVESIKEERNSVQFGIAGVVVPRNSWHGILRLEQVGNGRVVDDDYILHGAAQPGQVLDKGVIEEGAVLTEQQVRTHLLWVEMLHQRLCILGKTGREDDQLVCLMHALEELSHEWAHQDVDWADLTIDFDWEHDVGILHRLERRVHEGFV